MAKRLSLHPGDIFEVPLNEKKQFIQYLMTDSNMFNAHVIRAYDYEAPDHQEVNLADIVKSRIKFHTHTIIKGGIKLCSWKKVGNIPLEADFVPPLFRATNDTYSEVKKSRDWYIWRAGEESKKIGVLKEQYKSLDYGSVFHPIDIGKWLQTGSSGFMFPD